ncbi:aldo/keto reductase [Paenibacillus silviterrae]|uniref:aldo/keto reductase n=1 Tax=Paenibacillus silviterrae TaxID=3242194 RepID=UPI002542E357|nr:aldo/keto reductase [Paenibacillus chinjuensis]
MNYRKLGKTGLEVSALSFGASSLGSVFRDTDERESIRTVHTALDLGINLLDVSPYYGLTKAETVLGKAISQVVRDRFILTTKAGRYGADVFDFSAQRLTDSVEESLRRLRTDCIDILFLHDLEFVPFEQAEGAFTALRHLKEAGKIRYYGVSGLPLSLFEKAIGYTELDAILSYCHYSLNDTSLLELLPLLESRNIGLINASPLSMGLLSTRPVPNWHPAGEEIRAVCKQAAVFCAEQGADLTKLAIQFSVSDERIPTTLVSTANPENITKNIEWANEPMDQALLEEVLAILEPIRNKTWPSGQPEYNETIKL